MKKEVPVSVCWVGDEKKKSRLLTSLDMVPSFTKGSCAMDDLDQVCFQ